MSAALHTGVHVASSSSERPASFLGSIKASAATWCGTRLWMAHGASCGVPRVYETQGKTTQVR